MIQMKTALSSSKPAENDVKPEPAPIKPVSVVIANSRRFELVTHAAGRPRASVATTCELVALRNAGPDRREFIWGAARILR